MGQRRRSSIRPPAGPSRFLLVRTALGLRQVEVARTVEIGLSTYNLIEQGLSLPTAAVLSRLTRLFKVSPRTLLPEHTVGDHDEEGNGSNETNRK